MNIKGQMTLGTDPEFFAFSGDGIVSSLPLMKNGRLYFDKYNKCDLADGNAIYHDNILVEANVPPSRSVEEFVANLRILFSKTKERFKDFKLIALSSHYFDPKECRSRKAKEFGCAPEFDVDMECEVLPPKAEEAKTFRSAGGHIHIGLSESDFFDTLNNKVITIKAMDAFVGIPSLIINNDKTAHERQRLYGKAGRFRFTHYGVEYRVLSNFWTASPELAMLVSELTQEALHQSQNNQDFVNSFDRKEIVECINSFDRERAKEIIKKIGFSEDIISRIAHLEGAEHKEDIYENWGI
jgi:hypothetical protein